MMRKKQQTIQFFIQNAELCFDSFKFKFLNIELYIIF